MITLREIDRHNFDQVIELSVTEEQRKFVASNMYSLAQAKAYPECIPLALYHEEDLVGFVMYCMDEDDKEYWIYRLMIDKKYQRLGYGRQALECVLTRLKADKQHNKVYISFEPENVAAKTLYETLGFIPDGRMIGGEVVYCLTYNMPEAIFFDLDDTLTSYDSIIRPAWTMCCNEFVLKHAMPFSSRELYQSIEEVKEWYWADPIRHKVGRENLKEARREVVRYALEQFHITEESLVCELADQYTEKHNSMIELLPKAKEALLMLHNKGIRMAVITNGPAVVQREKLARFGLTDYFEHIFTDTEVGFSKPDIRMYQHALQTMELRPEQVYMVGDNLEWDVMGAKEAGIFAVWNDNRGQGLKSEEEVVPDMIVNSIYDLAKIICE